MGRPPLELAVAETLLDEHLDGLTDTVGTPLRHQFLGEGGDLLDPPGHLRLGELAGQGGGLGAVLVGVAEDPDRVQPRAAQEQLQLAQVIGGLAGEADDEIGPHAGLRGDRPDPLQQIQETLPVAEPAHRAQQRAAGVLEGQIEVRGHARCAGDGLDETGPELGRLQVADPHPLDAGDRRQGGQYLLQQAQVAEVLAVGGGVLADQVQFPDAARGQPFGLGEQLGRPARQIGTAERRDGAEGAPPVAAGSDLERRGDAVRQPAARRARARRRGEAGRQVTGHAGRGRGQPPWPGRGAAAVAGAAAPAGRSAGLIGSRVRRSRGVCAVLRRPASTSSSRVAISP